MSAIASWTALLKVIVVKCHVTLFIVCIPILILSGAVTWAINDIGLYQKGFDKYHISTKTGISSDNLTDVSRQIQRYFNSPDEPLFVKTKIFGDERILFNDREATHMRDVKKTNSPSLQLDDDLRNLYRRDDYLESYFRPDLAFLHETINYRLWRLFDYLIGAVPRLFILNRIR